MTDDLIARGKEAAMRHAEEAARQRPPLDDDYGRRIVITRGSQVKLKPLVWWEPGLILCHAINVVGGREGRGKSTIVANWVARETRQGGDVVWLGSEESREHVIAPRLVAAEADMDRVIFLDVETDLGTGALVFPLDLAAVEDVLADNNVTMMVLDPAKGLAPPGFSGNDDVAVRQFLEPIASMVARCNVTLLAIAHFGKKAGDDSGRLLLGSVAWSQVARSVVSVAEDPETENRIVTATKGNYAATNRSIEYRFVSKTVHTEDGATEFGAAELIGDTTKDARDYLVDCASEDARDIDRWLNDFLATGSKKANDVYSAADAAGYSKDQAKRAKKRIGVEAVRETGDGPWFWKLPHGRDDQGSTTLSCSVAPLLPCTSEPVREPEKPPREQSADDCSLGAGSNPSPALMPSRLATAPPCEPRQRRRTIRGRPASADPDCLVCGQPVVGGQGDTHFSCSKQEAAS